MAKETKEGQSLEDSSIQPIKNQRACPLSFFGKEQANCDILFFWIPKFLKVRAMVEAEQQPV